MSNDSNVTTLYFESTGSGGSATPRGRSGQTNQALPFTSVGSTGSHGVGHGTLPRLVSNGLATLNNVGEGHGLLPLLTSHGRTGAIGHGQLPSLLGHGSGTLTGYGRGHGVLPRLLSHGHALVGAVGRGHATLPVPTSFGRTGLQAHGVLPRLFSSGFSRAEISIAGHGGRLPALRGSGSAHWIIYNVGRGHGILPAVTSTQHHNAVHGHGVLPSLRGRGLGISGTVVERVTWATNIENNAVTEFAAFEFLQFGRAFNTYWGVGLDGGLYRMGGDTDAGSPISWNFETGISDLGSRGLKGLLGVYLDGIFERHIEFTIVADRGRYVYNHTVRGNQEDHQTQRISTGRGIRTANVGLGLASAKGAYFEMDSMTPEYVVTNRNVG